MKLNPIQGRMAIQAFAVILLSGVCASAANAADYYAGKTIELTVGSSPGGGYDTYARLLARHLPKHIPGNPKIIVKNRPGAGSLKAAGYLYSVAPKDGTAMGGIIPTIITGARRDAKIAKRVDGSKFEFIGAADNTATMVCASYTAKSKIKSLKEVLKRKTTVGASGVGSTTAIFPTMMNATTGTKFDVIVGYKGTRAALLAMEQGELDAMCGMTGANFLRSKKAWFKKGKATAKILVQIGLHPDRALSKMRVPMVWDFIKGEDERQLLEFLIGDLQFGRPYVMPPGTNPKAVKIVRAAFDAAMKDKALKAEAKKRKLTISPVSGANVKKLVAGVYATPQSIVDAYKKALSPLDKKKKK